VRGDVVGGGVLDAWCRCKPGRLERTQLRSMRATQFRNPKGSWYIQTCLFRYPQFLGLNFRKSLGSVRQVVVALGLLEDAAHSLATDDFLSQHCQPHEVV
jgi:hypothetical protein